MPARHYRFGALKIMVQYVQWRSGSAFFRRRIPDDLTRYYPGRKGFMFFSLKTKNEAEAARKASDEAIRLDTEWERLRGGGGTTAEVRAQAEAILRKHDLRPGQAAEYRRAGLSPDGFIAELEADAGLSPDPEGRPEVGSRCAAHGHRAQRHSRVENQIVQACRPACRRGPLGR